MRTSLFYHCYRGSSAKISEFHPYVSPRRGLGWWWPRCGLRQFMVSPSILGDCFSAIYLCILFLKDTGTGDSLPWAQGSPCLRAQLTGPKISTSVKGRQCLLASDRSIVTYDVTINGTVTNKTFHFYFFICLFFYWTFLMAFFLLYNVDGLPLNLSASKWNCSIIDLKITLVRG